MSAPVLLINLIFKTSCHEVTIKLHHCPAHGKFKALYLLYFLKYFDLERSSSLMNEPVINGLLCISRELSEFSLITEPKQLKEFSCSKAIYIQLWFFICFYRPGVLNSQKGARMNEYEAQVIQRLLQLLPMTPIKKDALNFIFLIICQAFAHQNQPVKLFR